MSSGSGTCRGYFVDARMIEGTHRVMIDGPPKIGHTWITESWKRISYDYKHPTIGVKNRLYSRVAEQSGMLSYAAAMALMAWAGSHHESVEFRLVKAKCVWSFEITEEGVSEPESFGLFAGRDIEFTPTDSENEPDDTEGENA